MSFREFGSQPTANISHGKRLGINDDDDDDDGDVYDDNDDTAELLAVCHWKVHLSLL